MIDKINKNILQKLYRGEIRPDAEILITDEYQENSKLKEKLYNNIKKELTTETIEKLEKYSELQNQLASIDAENQFMTGFKLATSIIFEGLQK